MKAKAAKNPYKDAFDFVFSEVRDSDGLRAAWETELRCAMRDAISPMLSDVVDKAADVAAKKFIDRLIWRLPEKRTSKRRKLEGKR